MLTRGRTPTGEIEGSHTLIPLLREVGPGSGGLQNAELDEDHVVIFRNEGQGRATKASVHAHVQRKNRARNPPSCHAKSILDALQPATDIKASAVQQIVHVFNPLRDASVAHQSRAQKPPQSFPSLRRLCGYRCLHPAQLPTGRHGIISTAAPQGGH